jgi:hypothetical protein
MKGMTGYEGKGSKEATSNFKHTLGAVSRRSGFYFHQNATFVSFFQRPFWFQVALARSV